MNVEMFILLALFSFSPRFMIDNTSSSSNEDNFFVKNEVSFNGYIRNLFNGKCCQHYDENAQPYVVCIRQLIIALRTDN